MLSQRAPVTRFRPITGSAVRSFVLYSVLSVAFVLATFLLLGLGVLWVTLPTLRWLTLPALAGAVLCSVVIVRDALPLAEDAEPRGPQWVAVTGLVAATTLLATVHVAEPHRSDLSMVGYVVLVCGMVLGLSVRWRWALALTAIPSVASLTSALVADRQVGLVASGLAMALLVGPPIGWFTAWSVNLVRRQARHHQVAADLAVAEERLRFGRDLHDVLGRTLSVVSLKSELASELARRGDGEAAAAEMDAVRGVAHEALGDLRGVVRGYRRLDPATELAGAVALLRSSGAQVAVDGTELLERHGSWPDESADALGWTLREGVTNVLRHSTARRVSIGLAQTSRAVTLRLTNDESRRQGSVPPGEAHRGAGLPGLRERVDRAGGRLTTTHEDGQFTLAVELPTEEER